MDAKIRHLLLLFLRERVITTSWGISNIRISTKSIAFNVDAMRYHGHIEISPINTTDCIVRIGETGKFQCSNEDLIFLLDNFIERSTCYYTNLLDWLDL
jgi:hypothetical protein